MKSNIKPLFLFAILALLLTSCVSRKEMVYFQNMEELEAEIDLSQATLKIQPNDLLTITVSAANMEAVQPFNLPITTAPRLGETSVSGNLQLQTYLVDSEGNIDFPQLGTIHVAGKTRQELTQSLKEEISK